MLPTQIEEFQSNLQLLLHNRHPEGMKVENLSEEYEKYFLKHVEPNMLYDKAKNWKTAIEKSQHSLRKRFRIFEIHDILFIKTLERRSEKEMRLIAQLSNYYSMLCIGKEDHRAKSHQILLQNDSGSGDMLKVTKTEEVGLEVEIEGTDSDQQMPVIVQSNEYSLGDVIVEDGMMDNDDDHSSRSEANGGPFRYLVKDNEIVDISENDDSESQPMRFQVVFETVNGEVKFDPGIQLVEPVSLTNSRQIQPVTTKNSVDKDTVYLCEWTGCDRTFTTLDLLQNHMKIVHVLSKQQVISSISNLESGETVVILSNSVPSEPIPSPAPSPSSHHRPSLTNSVNSTTPPSSNPHMHVETQRQSIIRQNVRSSGKGSAKPLPAVLPSDIANDGKRRCQFCFDPKCYKTFSKH